MATKKILIQVVLDDKDVSKVSRGTKQMADSIDDVSMAQRRYFKALQPTNLEVEKFRILTKQAEAETRRRALAELQAADATKKSRAQSGLNNAILIELGRTASDASYGFQGMANNIGRLFELGQEFARTGKEKGSLQSALKDLKNSIFGTGGILIGIQLLIGFLPQISRWFGKTAKGVQETNDALSSLSANMTVAEEYVDIIQEGNISEDNRRGIIKELIKLVPTLKEEDLKYGENLDLVRDKIIEYALAQASRIEIDNLVQENSESLAKRRRILSINQIEDEEQRVEAIKQFLKDEGISLTESFAAYSGSTGRYIKTVAKTREDVLKEFQTLSTSVLEETDPILEKIKQLTTSLILGGGDGVDKTLVEKYFEDLLQTTKDIIGGRFINEFDPLFVLFNDMFSFEDEIAKSGERTKEMLKDVGEESKKRQADITRAQKLELEAREIMEKRYFSTLKNLSEGLKELGAFDDAFKIASIITEKAEAIGKIVMNTRKSNTVIRAAGLARAALGDATAVARSKAKILINNIGSGIDIAAIVAQAAGSIQAIRSKTSVAKISGGGAALGGGGDVEAPDFNVVGAGGVSQLATGLAGITGKPIQAFVVSKEISSAQELDRNITNNASLG